MFFIIAFNMNFNKINALWFKVRQAASIVYFWYRLA